MFGNTQVITWDTVSKTLTKINQDSYSGEYLLREATCEYRMKIRHSKANSAGVSYDRHNVEITRTVFATSTVPEFRQRAYLVAENLPSDDDAEVASEALSTWMAASSGANLDSLVGWES